MAQRKARGARTAKAKTGPARKRPAKKATRGRAKAPRRATASAAAGAERRMIEALRSENRRLRDELETLRAERVAPVSTGQIPTLPLGEPS